MADPAQKTSPKNIVNLSPDSTRERNSREENSSYSNQLIQSYEARLSQLHGWLEAERQNYRELERKTCDDKNRLEDKITELNQKLREDNTETKLAHKDEIFELKESHREALAEKTAQINKLERKIEIENLKQTLGGKRGVGDRVMDYLEESGGDFISNLIQGINQMAQNQGVPPQQLSGKQYQQAVNNAQAAATQKNIGEPEKANQPHQPIADPVNPQETAENPQQEPEMVPVDQLSTEQLASVKEQIKDGLLNAAIQALTNQNANLGDYAQTVRQQIAINQEAGVQLDAKQWVQMANVIAEKAIEKEITPERVGAVIRPALDNVDKGKSMLQHLPPAAATNMLFDFFKIEASEPVKKLVTQVLAGFKQNLK